MIIRMIIRIKPVFLFRHMYNREFHLEQKFVTCGLYLYELFVERLRFKLCETPRGNRRATFQNHISVRATIGFDAF